MKIYRVDTDITSSQIIQRDDRFDLFTFDCRSKIHEWLSEGWYIYNPIDASSNFYSIPAATLIFDEAVYESDLYTLLEKSGEVLPVTIDDRYYYFLNVTACINTLNKEKTTHFLYPDGSKGRLKDYVFLPKRIGGNPLFKIPETRKTEVLCFEGVVDPQDEFKYTYDKLGLTRLEFVEIYDSEARPAAHERN